MMDVVCLGELLVDMFPSHSGVKLADVPSFEPKPGGAPANVAVSLARLGVQSAFIGKVGEDAFGHHLARILSDEGVETKGLRFDPFARTTLAFIAKPDVDTAEFLFYRNPGADTRLEVEELDSELLKGARILHLGSLSLVGDPIRAAALKAIELTRGSGGKISLDVNYRPSLWSSADRARSEVLSVLNRVHLLKVNEDELALLSGLRNLEEGSRKLIELGPEAVVVTLGSRGSFFNVGGRSGFVPSFQVQTIDATGCGDAFVAGILRQLVEAQSDGLGWEQIEWGEALRFANAVGALTAMAIGVIPALPGQQDVVQFLLNN